MALIPILKIKKLVDLILEFLETDYTNAVDKEKSFIYKILSDNIDNGFNFYTEAVEIFTRKDNDKRSLETRLGFDPDRASLPTIHVREPAKSKGKTDGIGFMGDEVYVNEDNSVSSQARKSYSSKYELVVTAGTSLEVICITEVLESAMLATYESLTGVDDWIDLIDFDTKEMIIANDSLPKPLFSKIIGVSTSFEKTQIPKLYTEENITTIEFNNPELLNL